MLNVIRRYTRSWFTKVLFYFLARTFLAPIVKSRSIVFFKEHPLEALLGLGVVGFVIDVGKTVGTWQGVRCYYFPKSGAADR